MKILLDTHTFLWFISGDAKLTGVARLTIEDLDNERFLSIASLWEIAIKTNLGRLNVLPEDETFANFFEQEAWCNSIEILPIELPHVALVASLPQHHRDPFDRLLVAQAQTENMVLISADSALDAYPIERRW